MKKIAIFLSLLAGVTMQAFAGVEPEIKSFITGTAISASTPTLVTYDAVFYNSAGTRNGTSTSIYSGLVSARNLTWLEINQATLNDCLVDSFKFSLTLTIEPKDENGDALPTYYDTLTVNYNKAFGVSYTDKHSVVYYGGYWCRVTVTSISSSTYEDYVQLNNSLLIERYVDINTATIPTFNTATISEANGSILVDWNSISGAEEYDLEWTYIDDFGNPDIGFGTAGSTVAANAINWSFKNNSTRVTIKGNSYKITYLNEHGYLLVRLRAIGRTGALFTHRVEGAWSSDDYGPKISNTSGTSFTLGEDAFQFVFATAESGSLGTTGVVKVHEATLNWQYVSTFAEEGKKKEVIGYSDGSMRGRQSVTLLNSDNTAIAGETIYDYQGRQAGSFMPVPTFENRLKFYPNFNLSSWSGKNYGPQDFDSTTNYCNTRHIATMDESAGAGKYYSANNPLSGNMHYEYLPDAQGYAFALTEYMPDGTGRVRRQSGVGPDHKLGSGHETHYFYGTPDQVELDRLFGTAVGYSQHYQKNMVIDPNGQVSVSYLDLQGRVIATALAGAAPDNLEALPSNTTPGTLTVKVNVDPNSDILGTKIQTVKQFLVTVQDDHTFDYSITIPRHTEDSKPLLCFDCVYTLEIQLLDDCGVNILDGDPNTGGVQLFSRTVGRPQAATEWDVSCSTVLYSFTLDDALNNAAIELNLPVGSYTLIKTLTINEEAYTYYESAYLADNDSIKTQEDFFNEFIASANFGQCETNCDSCFAKLGTWETFQSAQLSRLIAAEITPNGDDSAAILGTYQSMYSFCQGLCVPITNSCDQMLDILRADVSPGGQYAPITIVDNVTTFGGIYNADLYEIANLGFAYDVSWIGSSDPDNPVQIVYKDEEGNPILVQIDNVLKSPSELTPEQYINNFKPSWANTLATYHPEYCKYAQCLENYGAELYEQNMLKVTTFQEALDSGFLNPLDTTLSPFAAGRNDPYFQAGGNGVANRIALINLMNEYKNLDNTDLACSTLNVWDLAKATFLCNYESCEEIHSCLDDNSWGSITCTPVLDNIWVMFRSIYLAERRKIIEANYPENCPRTIALSGYIERFPKLEVAQSLVINEENNTEEETTNSYITYMLECDTVCIANADIWIGKLKNCGWTEADSTNFRNQLIAVCQNACDPTHPYGASSYPSGRNRVAVAKSSYTSFKAVFDDYVNLGKIAFSPGACDMNSLDYPLDYDHNYTRFIDNNGQPCTKDGFAPDPCTQTMGNTMLKDLYKQQHQYQIPDSVKCEKCITCKQLHTALSVIEFDYNGDVSDTTFDIKLSIANALNRQLNFNLNWLDYYDFMIQCGEFNPSDSDILQQFKDLWAFNSIQNKEFIPSSNLKLNNVNHHVPLEKRPSIVLASMDVIMHSNAIIGDSTTLNACMCNVLQDPDPNISDPETPGSLYNCLASSGIDFNVLKTFCLGFYSKYNDLAVLDKNSIWDDDDKERLKITALRLKLYVPEDCFVDPACDDPPVNITNPFYDSITRKPPTGGYGSSSGGGGSTPQPPRTTSCDSMKLFLHLMDSICVANFTCTPSFKEMIKLYLFNKNHSSLASNTPLLVFVNDQYEAMFPHLMKDDRFPSDPYKKFLAIMHLYNECIRESYYISNPACCREPNKHAWALMATINKMAGNFDPIYGNVITVDNQNMHPDYPQYYNSDLYDGIYKSTVKYITDPFGMPDLTMKFTDSLTHVRKIILSYTNNLYNEADWSYITRVKDFRLITVDYECDSSNFFEFTAVQLTSRGEEEVRISGYFPGINLGDTCDPNPDLKLCDRNYWESPFPPDTSDCFKRIENWATYMSERAYDNYIKLQKKGFRERYLAKCLGEFSGELFTIEKPDNEYHHTLYYYDQAGNLMQTIPPLGVDVIANSTTLTNILSSRISDGSPVLPSHTFNSKYEFNSLDQLIVQQTPDGGESKFWYDNLGRIVVSQNAKQYAMSPKAYSYSIFDELGRMKEVGQLQSSTTMTVAIAFNPVNLASFINSESKTEVTRTIYDLSVGSFPSSTYFVQENLRSRVSSMQYFPTLSSGLDASGSYSQGVHYTYDIHGNVNVLLREIPELYDIGQSYKSIIYTYDLVSGNVNKVHYQLGQADMFAHKYVYDADNRISETYTSRDLLFWEMDAAYSYYLHGPMSRTEIGELKVQGVDYVYNLQGWIKGVNSTTLNTGRDVGKDGNTGSDNELVAKDVFGYSLGFFENDYLPIGLSRSSSPLQTTDLYTPSTNNRSFGSGSDNLYNGNIKHMVTAIKPFMQIYGMPQARAYQYDQLNRIKSAYTYNKVELDSNVWKWNDSPVADYEEHFSYDANGNILTLQRNGTSAWGYNLDMDDFTYNYQSGTNKLTYVDDSKASGNYPDDIDDQSAGNYTYDEIGNMTSDAAEQIANIEWTVYGKIKSITRTGGSSKPNLEFEYSPDGYRVSKKSTMPSGEIEISYYIRDAQGNVMSIYTRNIDAEENDTFSTSEFNLYGSSRLGIYNCHNQLIGNGNEIASILPANQSKNYRGKKSYELSNHLGNVLVVVSDKRTAVCESEEIVNYEAEILNATDYYAFGSPMPLRTGLSECTAVSDTTINNNYELNEDFNTGSTGSFSAGNVFTAVNNFGTELDVSSSGTMAPVTSATFNMVSGENYNLQFDVTNMSSVGGYTTEVHVKVKDGTTPIASTIISSISNANTLNFNGSSTTTATLEFSYVLVAIPGPPPPPATYPQSFNLDNIFLYSIDTVISIDSSCSLISGGYRYGFNGMEKVSEISGEGNGYDFGARIYDGRLGRWFSLDPLFKKRQYLSAYLYVSNSPISLIDIDGEDEYLYITIYNERTKKTKIRKIKISDKFAEIKSTVATSIGDDYSIIYNYYNIYHFVNVTIKSDGTKVFSADHSEIGSTIRYSRGPLTRWMGKPKKWEFWNLEGKGEDQPGGIPLTGDKGGISTTKTTSENPDQQVNIDLLLAVFDALNVPNLPKKIEGAKLIKDFTELMDDILKESKENKKNKEAEEKAKRKLLEEAKEKEKEKEKKKKNIIKNCNC